MASRTRQLIDRLAAAERAAVRPDRPFLAPCAAGGSVQIRIDGLLRAWRPTPRAFEGWGVFRPVDARTVRVEICRDRGAIRRWLGRHLPVRLHLVRPLTGQTWLAWPADTESFERRIFEVRPMPVHLVSAGRPFGTVWARWDGGAFWFERAAMTGSGTDRKTAERLADAARAENPQWPDSLRLRGITPELRTAFAIRVRRLVVPAARAALGDAPDEARLRSALAVGGGRLHGHVDHCGHWTVEWEDRLGRRLHSAISKSDLTVLSAGICLEDRDADFDLQSLVGVVSDAEDEFLDDW